ETFSRLKTRGIKISARSDSGRLEKQADCGDQRQSKRRPLSKQEIPVVHWYYSFSQTHSGPAKRSPWFSTMPATTAFCLLRSATGPATMKAPTADATPRVGPSRMAAGCCVSPQAPRSRAARQLEEVKSFAGVDIRAN